MDQHKDILKQVITELIEYRKREKPKEKPVLDHSNSKVQSINSGPHQIAHTASSGLSKSSSGDSGSNHSRAAKKTPSGTMCEQESENYSTVKDNGEVFSTVKEVDTEGSGSFSTLVEKNDDKSEEDQASDENFSTSVYKLDDSSSSSSKKKKRKSKSAKDLSASKEELAAQLQLLKGAIMSAFANSKVDVEVEFMEYRKKHPNVDQDKAFSQLQQKLMQSLTDSQKKLLSFVSNMTE